MFKQSIAIDTEKTNIIQHRKEMILRIPISQRYKKVDKTEWLQKPQNKGRFG